MTRIMFDGITASALPVGAVMVAGYVDGHWPDAPALAERFPHALLVRIAVSASTNDGVVLDVETGDATPEEAVNWVLARRHAGVEPSVYCGEAAWSSVKAAFSTHDVPQPHYWVAQYDNVAVLPVGAIAKQFKSTPGWDESVVADYWPGVDPAPIPAAAAALEEDEMSTTSVNGRAGLSWPQGSRHVVQVTYDPHAGNPVLRVVLALTTGPWVAPEWKPANGSGVYEVPEQYRATCRGVILQGSAVPVYDATAA